ncbi:hypothetical protein KEM52_001934 [Ascosphaera acerosa]|nr:hypothetical protein KEM52_001934 [Ascosphaera acerosa]
MQERVRTPALDTWFALTANLGTHTFFMVMLPVFFWCGYTSFGRGLVRVLACGVYLSGFVKDMLCLPRPLSPPLTRITMSKSAALEYGFPSTHSTNAVSAAYYCMHLLNRSDKPPLEKLVLQALFLVYAVSIVVGRLYCGMHGFSDVVVGSLLGVLLAWLQCEFGPMLDAYLFNGGVAECLVVILVILVLIRIHPEPADSCPCFDDSVAFFGVLIGQEFSNRMFAETSFSRDYPSPGTIPYDLRELGLVKSVLRISLGVLTVFIWRGAMKPSLHRVLPPVFRVLERIGVHMPRRFFTKASEYTKIPMPFQDNDLIPSVSELPDMLDSMRHPRQRAISVGPVSEADAYETLAYRQKKQRRRGSAGASGDFADTPAAAASPAHRALSSSIAQARAGGRAPSPALSKKRSIDHYESMMGETPALSEIQNAVAAPAATSLSSPASPLPPPSVAAAKAGGDADSEENEKIMEEMFRSITRPRVRYDVEVVTKLIVYSGIAWLAVCGNPIMYYYLGLAPA